MPYFTLVISSPSPKKKSGPSENLPVRTDGPMCLTYTCTCTYTLSWNKSYVKMKSFNFWKVVAIISKNWFSTQYNGLTHKIIVPTMFAKYMKKDFFCRKSIYFMFSCRKLILLFLQQKWLEKTYNLNFYMNIWSTKKSDTDFCKKRLKNWSST